jgi:hypothetical protein
MRQAIIFSTLIFLLMAVAGITVAQEDYRLDRRSQTEPASQDATIREPIELVDERSVEGNDPTREVGIENPDGSEVVNSEVAEDKAARAESKGLNRVRPENTGKPEDVGNVSGKGKPPSTGKPGSIGKPGSMGKPEELGKPEGGEGPEGRGKLTSKGKPVDVGKGESTRRPIGATKAKGDSQRTHDGRGQKKITLCHKGKHTITVGAPAKGAHLRHGDSLGDCEI